MAALIDRYLPNYDVRERHHLRVHASPEVTYAAVQTADLARSRVVALLLAMRTIPTTIAQGMSGARSPNRKAHTPVTLAGLAKRSFRILEDSAPDELVIGLEGQFWRASGGVCTPDPDTFLRSMPSEGTARAVWNFRVLATTPDYREVWTVTRVLCASPEVRRRFLPYWWLIRPGSRAIRRAMLRAIRDHAEHRVTHAS